MIHWNERLTECFAEALLSGASAPLPIDDSIANMRAIDGLRASARADGRRVRLA